MTGHPQSQPMMTGLPGPCIICGGTNYDLSCGGPTICPKCDCGQFDAATVMTQSKALASMRAKVDDLTVLGLFLVNRLDEFDPGDFDAERDFHGHVAPALARFRGALAVNSQDRK